MIGLKGPTNSGAPSDQPAGRIGPRVLPSRYFLAPLAGYTQLSFRRAIRELGGLGLATTDLVQAGMLLSGRRKSLDIVATHSDDRPLSVQIFGGRKDELARAARWLQEHGYEGIDINMGCPMAKVNGHGGGARLMCDTGGACATVQAVLDAVTVPVSVKMRLGWDRTQLTAPALAHEFEQLGVAAVTIHGRTRQQGFHGSVDLNGIREVVEAVDRIPIIGNGDVRTIDDALYMRRVTGCAAVAIGRGAMLDPWIFRKLDQASRGEPVMEPTSEEQIHFLMRHFRLMANQQGEYACTLFRKFAAWYGARLGIPEDLEDRLRRFGTIAEFEQIAEAIHSRHGERQSRIATALVKVPNGPNELW
jgi:nifR3 family TIM-barrel protein